MTGSEVGRRAGVIASVRSGSGELRVEVLGDEIIVILPATSYGVTYYKPTHSAHLLVKNFLSKIDRGVCLNDFLSGFSGVCPFPEFGPNDHRSRGRSQWQENWW